jgi:hypothetical protein
MRSIYLLAFDKYISEFSNLHCFAFDPLTISSQGCRDLISTECTKYCNNFMDVEIFFIVATKTTNSYSFMPRTIFDPAIRWVVCFKVLGVEGFIFGRSDASAPELMKESVFKFRSPKEDIVTDIKNRVFKVNGEHQNAWGIPRVYCIDRRHIDSHTRTPDSMKCGSHIPSRCASISLRPLWRTSECSFLFILL